MAIPFAGFAIYIATGDALLVRARAALERGEVDSASRLEERARSWHMTADEFFALRFEALANRQRDLRARVGLWQLAMASANRAAETAEDRQNALILRASLQAAVNDSVGVERTLRDAIEFAPKFYKSHWLLAQVLELEGRREEARAEAQAAMDLGGEKHPEVVQTYQRLAR